MNELTRRKYIRKPKRVGKRAGHGAVKRDRVGSFSNRLRGGNGAGSAGAM